MVSWTIPLDILWKKIQMIMILQTIPLTQIVEKNADSNGLTDPSDTASIFYLLIVKSSKSSISIIVMQSELPIVNLLFMFFH